MRRKAIAALGMAVLMTVGPCVPVLAADTEASGSDSSNATGQTTVTYTQPVSYTALIPSGVSVDKDNGATIAVSIKDAILETGKAVTVSTDVVGDKITVGTGDDTQELSFALTGSAKLDGTNPSCSFTVGKPASAFKTAGDHTATVTFTFTYGNVTP